ncbi:MULTISPECIES: peptidoglycan bridge formation glycyltransferase FemA/FemB family protein [Terrabacteria group]|uniref:lipid II:glycine glycyltransferase FemX n=1 Tax=Bacillati TaxID=1783272 RepID=UPI001C6E9986|nr:MULTISPECIES: peptidoglycan bridge formation glycyltransferase FemA/FemB family protein [Terrabacteria group]MBW9212666.1 aminoacyltransferase [Trueperella sp. zg.1013]
MIYKQMEDVQQFDAFVQSHPYSHFQKTAMWGEFIQKTEHSPYHMLGFYNNQNELVATALILVKKTLFGHYLYVPKGPCVDYKDQKLTNQVLTLLKEYTKKNRALFMTIDPNVLRMERDIKGNKIEHGENNEFVTEYINQIGFKHRGYTYAYDGSFSNRFTLITKLDEPIETIFKGFSTLRKRSIKKNHKFHLYTVEADRSEIQEFVRLEDDLGKTKEVIRHPLSFYEAIYDAFAGHVHFYKTILPMESYLSVLLDKTKSDNPKEASSALKHYQEALKLQKEKGNNPVLAVGMIFDDGHVSYGKYYYRDHAIESLSPLDSLLFHAIQQARNNGHKAFDFLGFGGLTTPHDWDIGYSLYQYKHQWNATFIEDIGQFDYVLNPTGKRALELSNKIKRKLQTLFIKLHK